MYENFRHFEEYQPIGRPLTPENSPFLEFDDRKFLQSESKNLYDIPKIFLENKKKKEFLLSGIIDFENINNISNSPYSSELSLELLEKKIVSKSVFEIVKQQFIQKDIISEILNGQLVGITHPYAKTFGQTSPSNIRPLLQSSGNYIYDDLLRQDKTTPEELPEMAMPILEFIDEVQPHIVIGCDRGGRLFSLAMHAAWRETRAGQPFPTLDGKLHFARISKSEDPDILQEKIDQIVEASIRFGDQRGNLVEDGEQMRVLFVDDWIIGGGTKQLTERLMQKHNAHTYFAVLCGSGADVAGSDELKTRVSWHDRPEEIGVNYLSYVENNPDGSFTQKQEVVAVRGLEAVTNRRKIQEAARQLDPVRVLTEVA